MENYNSTEHDSAERYSPKKIEKKWQDIWDKNKAFAATNDYSRPKYYALVEFPYPSGQGLHVGHPRPYTALDIVARKRRMQGYNVLFPMGWDAFGLPTENYAIKNKIHPKIVTRNNVERFKSQLKSLGYSFDWNREVNTTDINYYKWTQWIFLKLFKAGLAYKKEMPINWCTSCKVGLANEEVVNGVCERCGSEVVRRVKSEWMLKITEYADRLIKDLDNVDYIEKVKVSQKNWIGRSEGGEVDFSIKDKEEKLRIYTTRPDTLFGVTYMVVSPEHPIIDKYKNEIKNWDAITEYREMASKKSDFEHLKYNTAIAAMMAILNDFYKKGQITKAEFSTLIILLNPVAPHITEELWEKIGNNGYVYEQTWPKYDEAKTVESTVEIAVQVNGKVKAKINISLEDSEETVKEKVMKTPSVAAAVEGKNIVKEIYVKGKIYNIVVK